MVGKIIFRKAKKGDLFEILKLYHDDQLGAKRETLKLPLKAGYLTAFEIIDRHPYHEIIVAELNNEIIGTCQISFLRYLTYEGGERAQIEAVRIKSAFRGKGIGTKMIEDMIKRAKKRGCHLVQLTSNKKRKEAKRFYEALGFVATHEGFKLHL